jgi:replication factor A1
MSISVDELYQKLLESGISEAELEKQVQNKESEFGGFMSKQGILFIIAKENGIYVQSPEISEQLYEEFEEEIDYDEFSIQLSEIKDEMRNIVLLGKILQIFETRNFTRKDGTGGKVSSFLFGDNSETVKVVLWGDKADFSKNEYFRVNELIRIIGAYCKKGKDNNLEVHLGKRGKIILSPEIPNKNLRLMLDSIKVKSQNGREIKSKSTSTSKIKDLVESFKYIKTIQGQIKIEEFKEINKKSGEKTFLLKILLSDDSATIRVLIWGMFAIECLKIITEYDTVVISNVAVKENDYTREKELVFTKNSTLQIV